jgi:predicted SprT family Zn-dependent metalloprotease
MDIGEATTLARVLMNQHGLANWQLQIDDCKVRFGQCSYRNHCISLSRVLIGLNDLENVRDTILHEIAHALTPHADHGRLWKLTAQSIGARPVACYSSAHVKTPLAPWHAYCPKCHTEIKRHRMSRALLTGKYYCKCVSLPADNDLFLKWERV